MATESTENLFAAIYRLTRDASFAGTKDIADNLGVSLPTVSEKIVRLAEDGYLDHRWRKGVALTEKGLSMALQVLRKHRLIETFLVRILKFPIEDVNEEACRLEHCVSERFVDSLDTALGHPEADPHGHPIPSSDGAIKECDYQSLAEALPGSTVTVKQVCDRDRDQLHYLCELGIMPGARISVLEAAPFDGPLTLEMDGRNIVLGRSMSRRVGIVTENRQPPAKKEKKS